MNSIKNKEILKTHNFLVILQYFTVIYALVVIMYVSCICVVETLWKYSAVGCCCASLPNSFSDVMLIA